MVTNLVLLSLRVHVVDVEGRYAVAPSHLMLLLQASHGLIVCVTVLQCLWEADETGL